MAADTDSNPVERISWAARHYAPVVAAILGVAVVAALLVGASAGREPRYSSSALVIATQLELRQEQLPSFAESVFSSGAVADKVTARQGLAIDPRRLVPERIAMEPVSDAPSFKVLGYSTGAEEAAALANSAASAFVEEMNKAGEGVGTFTVHDAARVPLTAAPAGPGLPLSLLAGLVAGLVLALLVVGLLLGVRRPVLSGSQASGLVGAALLAKVTLPGGRSPLRPGLQARGVRALARGLHKSPHDPVLLVGQPRSLGARRELLRLLEEEFRASSDAESPTRSPAQPAPRPGAVGAISIRPDGLDRPPTLLLPEESLQARAADGLAGAVVVVTEGEASASVTAATDDLVEEELIGVVLLRRRSGAFAFRRKGAPATNRNSDAAESNRNLVDDLLQPADR